MILFKKTLAQKLESIGLKLNETVLDRCAAYYGHVLEANKHQNLTRITDEAQAAEQHFADAMALCRVIELPIGCRIIDMGTGAGFPGVPLKFLRGDIDLTLLDASGKKTEFIKNALADMNVQAHVICGRAEELGRQNLRESFDMVVSRAVASLPMLLELGVPLLRTGGTLAAWKGETFKQELKEAATAMQKLGCAETGRYTAGLGAILLIQKQKPTQEFYPRRFSKIKSSPL